MNGRAVYERIDAPATVCEKNVLKALSPERLAMKELAGEPVSGHADRGSRQRSVVRRIR